MHSTGQVRERNEFQTLLLVAADVEVSDHPRGAFSNHIATLYMGRDSFRQQAGGGGVSDPKQSQVE